ncbi:hypothetical protein EDD18DRAFT_1358369 [Armillaria luteobubalina]|uniref:Uncharacterized protein n=1 Tax=Armillaria luteobubalina TaxID=153913 RepID=A0AA39PYB2_9AGAR|nr:hypothetical protein EDD18DRAFT_1358369 [Armillaria luteobubalina]
MFAGLYTEILCSISSVVSPPAALCIPLITIHYGLSLHFAPHHEHALHVESLSNSSPGASKGSKKGVWAGYTSFRSVRQARRPYQALRTSYWCLVLRIPLLCLWAPPCLTNVVLRLPLLIDDDDDDASLHTPVRTPTHIRLLSAPTPPSQPSLLLMPRLSPLPPTPAPTQDMFMHATESRDSASESYDPERPTTTYSPPSAVKTKVLIVDASILSLLSHSSLL